MNVDCGTHPRADFDRLLGGFWLAAVYWALESGPLALARFLLSPLIRCVDLNQKTRCVAHAVK